MPNSWNEILSARAGSIVVNNTDVIELEFYAIKSVENVTIIDSLFQGEDNVTTEYVVDPATRIGLGAVITPKDINKPFTSITLSAGAVCLTLK